MYSIKIPMGKLMYIVHKHIKFKRGNICGLLCVYICDIYSPFKVCCCESYNVQDYHLTFDILCIYNINVHAHTSYNVCLWIYTLHIA